MKKMTKNNHNSRCCGRDTN